MDFNIVIMTLISCSVHSIVFFYLRNVTSATKQSEAGINTKFATIKHVHLICGTPEGEGITAESSRAQYVRKVKLSYGT